MSKKFIKDRFRCDINWKKSTIKIVDTHTGNIMTLPEWEILHLANILPQVVIMFLKKKGKIKGPDGNEFTREDLIKSLKQKDGKTKPEEEFTKFETDLDSDKPKNPSPKK
jgi:hypothetical protein